jgi:hypothetical protein
VKSNFVMRNTVSHKHKVIIGDCVPERQLYCLKLNINPWKRHIITYCIILQQESGSSVSIVSGYGLDDREIEVRSRAESKVFFL